MNTSSLLYNHETVCYVHQIHSNKGIFYGDNPFSFDTPLLLIQLSLCSVVTGILQHFLTPFGLSVFICQILTGVILGPTFLGRFRTFRDLVFPPSSYYIGDTFANFGVMLFLFIIGVKTDLSLIRESGKRAIAIGLGAFLTPLVLNFVVGALIILFTPMEPRLHMSIEWIATFQAFSSFHVIVCLLADLKLMNSELGRLAISSSMVSGISSWVWAIIVFTGKQSVRMKKPHIVPLMLLFIAITLLFAVFVFRPIVLWMIQSANNATTVKESHITAIFILVVGSALLSEIFGQHYLFGPMVLGMLVPDGPPLGTALVNKLESFISTLVLPVFFIVSGARIDFSSISRKNFSIITFMGFFSLVCKVVGVMVPSMLCKMPFTDAFCLGLILGSQGIIEVFYIERAQNIRLIDGQTYSIMVLSIVIFAGSLAPIVKYSYKPYKSYTDGKRRTIQHSSMHAELSILACVHYQEHTPSILNIFGASYPHPQGPICFYVIHLLDLAGRISPVFVAHQPGIKNPFHGNKSANIINALRFFEHEHQGSMSVFPFTAITPYASMHDDVCLLASEKKVSLVIVLFHKHPAVHLSEEEANSVRGVNNNIIQYSPCSVGILIDQGSINFNVPILSETEKYRVGMFFLSGPDDREALSYARRMAKHPKVRLTLVQFVMCSDEKSINVEDDLVMIKNYKDLEVKNQVAFYREELVKESIGLIGAFRKLEMKFDLILVGRRHDSKLPLLVGLRNWNEFPELGCVGDLLVSLVSDSKASASVLVVQQAGTRDDKVNEYISKESSTTVDLWWNEVKQWPSSNKI